MEIVIVGLGLIGGSIAKALKLNTPHRVLGMDISDDTLLDACSCGAIDGKATPSDLEKADLVYLSIYPEDILDFVRRYGNRLKPGCILTDACGIKGEIDPHCSGPGGHSGVPDSHPKRRCSHPRKCGPKWYELLYPKA